MRVRSILSMAKSISKRSSVVVTEQPVANNAPILRKEKDIAMETALGLAMLVFCFGAPSHLRRNTQLCVAITTLPLAAAALKETVRVGATVIASGSRKRTTAF